MKGGRANRKVVMLGGLGHLLASKSEEKDKKARKCSFTMQDG